MKTIFIFLFFLMGCSSLTESVSDETKSVIQEAKNTGGQKGIDLLNKKIKDLEDKISKKETEYRRIKKRIDDKEDDLDDLNDEIDEKKRQLADILERLDDDSLSPEERARLEAEAQRLRDQVADLESDKTDLENQINTLQTQKTQAEADRDQALADLDGMRQARDDLQEELRRAIAQRNTARDERDTARNERDTANRKRRTAEEERECWKRTRFNFCDRRVKLKDKIIGQVSGVSECENINICHLEDITTLDLSDNYDPANNCNPHKVDLRPSDFEGLKNLETLNLFGICLQHFESFTDGGFFKNLNSIREINLQDTGVGRLASNFFEDVTDTLADGGVRVTDFIYCSNQEPPYKDKLFMGDGDVTPTSDYPGMDTAPYCY